MDHKGGAPPGPEPMPNAPPPSYEQSMGQGASGGFVPPPQMPQQQDYKSAPPPGSYMAPPPGGQHGVGMPPGQQGTQQVIVVVNPPRFGPSPVTMCCPNCQSQIRTSTDSQPGPMAWILAGFLCVIGLWPCACIPCCIESLNCVTHRCPQCNAYLGRYKGSM